jgi:hypothetical protein
MNAQTATAPQAFVILVDGSVDQICGSLREARKEKKDLERMDCGSVRIKPFATWQEAEAFEDKTRGY